MRLLPTLLMVTFLVAACHAVEPPTASKPPRETYPLYGKVVSISSQALVIKGGKGKPDRQFTLGRTTQISKDNKPATLAQVVPGQWVGGLVRRTVTGPHLLEKLNLSVKQKP